MTARVSIALSLSLAVLACGDETTTISTDSHTSDSDAETTADAVEDALPDSVADTVADSVADSVADTVADSVADTVADSVAETTVEDVADSADSAEVVDETPPGPVTGLTLTGGVGTVRLTWTNPSATDFDSVAIRRGTSEPTSPGDGTLVCAPCTSPVVISDVNHYATTHFAVFSYDADGNYDVARTSGKARFAKPFSAISVFRETVFAIKSDGSLWGWGLNDHYELGDGTMAVACAPRRLGESTWSAVVAGAFGTMATRSDGKQFAWGDNPDGALGVGDFASHATPLEAPAQHAWTSLSAGHSFAVGIEGGQVYTWGWNEYGQLGNNMKGTSVHTPTRIMFDNDWTVVTAGHGFVAGIKSGALWTWGHNFRNELGQGQGTDDLLRPTKVGTDTDWVAVNAGFFHTLALKANGTLWGWGFDEAGDSSGTGGADKRIVVPTQIGADTDWVQVGAGGHHNLVLKADGSIWGFGWGANGRAGDGVSEGHVRALGPIGTDKDWVWVDGGYEVSYALKADGSLWAFGRDNRGQGGDGGSCGNETDEVLLPTKVLEGVRLP